MSDEPRYRLAPIDRTGVLFGLQLSQVVCGAATVVLTSVALLYGAAVIGFGVLLSGGALAAARSHGEPLVEQLPTLVALVRARFGRRTWISAMLSSEGHRIAEPLRHIDVATFPLRDEGGRRRRMVVTFDRRQKLVGATLRVDGRSLALAETAERHQAIANWAAVLSSLVSERPLVRQLRWSVWSAPADLSRHVEWLDANRDAPLPEISEDYDELIRYRVSAMRRHEVLITIAVDDIGDAALDTLVHELHLMADALRGSGTRVSGPLDAAAWRRAMRVRIAPFGPPIARDDSRLSVEPCSLESVTPLSMIAEWKSWHTDDAFHRAYLISEWPRSEVGPAWLADLTVAGSGVQSMTVAFEPVPRSDSRRAIARDAAKVASEIEQRAERGFRVGGWHRRAVTAVNEREAELVAGHAELRYVGLVTVAAASVADLDARSEQLVQRFAARGVELRPLNGQHDLAVCAGLPIARGIAVSRRRR